MVARKRSSQCRAPFHHRLYSQFNLQGTMPKHNQYNTPNWPQARGEKDMGWIWQMGMSSIAFGSQYNE